MFSCTRAIEPRQQAGAALHTIQQAARFVGMLAIHAVGNILAEAGYRRQGQRVAPGGLALDGAGTPAPAARTLPARHRQQAGGHGHRGIHMAVPAHRHAAAQ
jgi:hypothetical protein